MKTKLNLIYLVIGAVLTGAPFQVRADLETRTQGVRDIMNDALAGARVEKLATEMGEARGVNYAIFITQYNPQGFLNEMELLKAHLPEWYLLAQTFGRDNFDLDSKSYEKLLRKAGELQEQGDFVTQLAMRHILGVSAKAVLGRYLEQEMFLVRADLQMIVRPNWIYGLATAADGEAYHKLGTNDVTDAFWGMLLFAHTSSMNWEAAENFRDLARRFLGKLRERYERKSDLQLALHSATAAIETVTGRDEDLLKLWKGEIDNDRAAHPSKWQSCVAALTGVFKSH